MKKRLNCSEYVASGRKSVMAGEEENTSSNIGTRSRTLLHRLSCRQLTVFRKKKFRKLNVPHSVVELSLVLMTQDYRFAPALKDKTLI